MNIFGTARNKAVIEDAKSDSHTNLQKTDLEYVIETTSLEKRDGIKMMKLRCETTNTIRCIRRLTL
jgi:hypothetical protein